MLRPSDLSTHFGHTLLNFARAQVAYVGRHRPAMTKRVLELTISVAPEHVGDGHGDPRARGHGFRHDAVDVVDVQMDGDRRAFQCDRSEEPPLRILVDQHERRVTDPNSGMHQLAAGPRQAGYLDSVEGFLIELDGVGSTRADQVRRQRMHPIGNWLYGWLRHDYGSFSQR